MIDGLYPSFGILAVDDEPAWLRSLRVALGRAGIDHLGRLTDPFFTTKRDQGGTGLGLSVSATIVKEHGGTLEFRSTPGAGTTATLTLPELREEAAA